MANQHIEQKQQTTNSFSSQQEGSFEFRWKSFLRTTINQKAISSSFYASNLLRQSNFDREMSRQKEEQAYRDQIAVKLISATKFVSAEPFLVCGGIFAPPRAICIAVNASYDLCMRCLTEAGEQTRMFTKYHGVSCGTSVHLPALHT